ncbi:MAG: hypothetical protein JNN04_00750 [Cyclobacteriaceae bacterium]|nr:hypothetical protein [Cyclobacteriaceae bacterium]
MTTELKPLQNELASRSHRGITFIAAATLYWFGVGCAGAALSPSSAFMASIWGTGILFPTSIVLARLFRIDIFYKNQLTPLGIWANVFQLFFFPVLFVAAKANVYYPPVFMGVLAGAHFVFYHWLYQSRTYLVLAIAMTLSSYILGFLYPGNTYVVVGFSNAGWLLLGCLLLHHENQSTLPSPTTSHPH